MPKLQIKATELIDTDVSFVSLVKRGANRIPFRVVKEDNSMLDISKISRSLFKKADPKPEIVAAIISSEAHVGTAAEIFKSAGLDPKQFMKTEGADGTITVGLEGFEKHTDVAVLKVSDDVGLVVTGLQKAFHGYDFASTSFADVHQTNGFYSSLCTAGDSLRTVISNIMSEAESPSEAATSIQKAVDEFKTYATTLANALPVHAFKMDAAFQKVDKAAPVVAAVTAPAETVEVEKDGGGNKGKGFEAGKNTGTDPKATADDKNAQTADAKPGESTTGQKEKAKKADIPGLPDPKGHVPGEGPSAFGVATGDTARATAAGSADDKKMHQNGGTTGSSIPDGNSGISVRKEIDQTSEDADKKPAAEKLQELNEEVGLNGTAGTALDVKKAENDAVLAAIAALQKSMEEKVAAVAGNMEALSGRVEKLDAQVKKADAALNGTVFSEAEGDREAKVVKKTEGSGAPPLLDTAYSRHRAA